MFKSAGVTFFEIQFGMRVNPAVLLSGKLRFTKRKNP
jgi:hypothetical protein